ncbi:hypothetical protein FDECE_18537, partial [Fusarium decemcellulare]
MEDHRENLQTLIRESPPWWKSPSLRKLYFFLIAPLISSTGLGFDIAMTNGLQSVDHFMNHFGNPKGADLGFYGACMSVGSIIASLCAGPLIERFGRRLPLFCGASIVVGMAIMETFATSFAMFNGGKLVIGFGTTISQVSSTVLVAELAHPKQRVSVTSIQNTGIYFGMLTGAWITYGTYSMNSLWSWRIPCIIQAVLPLYQVAMIWFCPESPRWLISKNKTSQAREILIKYHGDGVETDLVRSEIQEIIAGIEVDATMLKFNKQGIQSILGSKGTRHRLWIIFWVAVGSQCLGNGLVSTYLPLILDQVGLTSSKEKTIINAVLNTWNLIVALPMALVSYRIPRRVLFLASTSGVLVMFVIWTALSAQYLQTEKEGLGIGVVAVIFIFNTFYSSCWVSMVVAYPLELTTTKQRAIFGGYSSFCVSCSSFIISYVNPIGLQNLSWRYYIIQCVFNCLVLLVIWFTFVETKGYTLEETAMIFDGGEQTFRDAVEAIGEALCSPS